MIEALKLQCRQERVHKTWAITHRSNAGAVGLYESTGAALDPGGDVVTFVYELDN